MSNTSRFCASENVWAQDEQSEQQSQDSRGIFDKQLKNLGIGMTWLAIILGQAMSVLLCFSTFATFHLVEDYNIRIPNAQNFMFYLVLTTVFTFILGCRSADRNVFVILKTRGWKYLVVAFLDSEAKYLMNKACQLTSVTSVQLLDCFAIPIVLTLSLVVLKIRFKITHIIGILICLLGVSCLVWANIEERNINSSDKQRFIGDMMCIAAALLMGLSNVAQELFVKIFDPVEYLGMIGLFGSIITGAQMAISEFTSVRALDWSVEFFTSPPSVCIFTYVACQALFYILSTFTIKWSSATLLNLSLISTDFLALIVSMYFLRVGFHALYFLSYLLVMIGILIFSVKPTILGSQVYVSLKRDTTTMLGLELMSTGSTEYSTEDLCIGGGTSSHLTRNLLRSQTLSEM